MARASYHLLEIQIYLSGRQLSLSSVAVVTSWDTVCARTDIDALHGFKFRGTPQWNSLHGSKLYDHEVDIRENINQADVPEYAVVRVLNSGRLCQRITCLMTLLSV
ncbi:hypothetical protein DPMN_085554 [Dreissena polymorpha]|uniref:Uncharacterized protein n=1 Tax=Dreissena polymorpha TaxID=45954 RepID=A0A9D3YGA4_DREPO|nr:hypothetical protein DPMN_085554 [Dreissena polymorpha]